MKIPALRAKIGDWTYYVTTLSFAEVNLFVSKVDEHLHTSESLKDLIQRSITKNFLSIKEYIINQPEVFFNSLVLAVYDDYPNWIEIEIKYDNQETYQMGLLEFPGHHKIFPVDGQHRVEGIKAALQANPSLGEQRIAAIFIGHKNDDAGKQRTRRLFTTLNRYAKPVALDDIIALDEDDSVAIITRFLVEEYDLFDKKRVFHAEQKAIPTNNKEAITSIITLYQSNLELVKLFYQQKHQVKPTKMAINEYLKFRRSPEEIEEYRIFCLSFWDSFKSKLGFIQDFVRKQVNPAEDFRNNLTGGNLLFRPIGFLPFIKAVLFIHKRTGSSFNEIFERFNIVNFDINSKPWLYVVWNPIEKKMVMSSDTVTQLLLVYLYDRDLINERELSKLRKGYASKISYQGDISEVLDSID